MNTSPSQLPEDDLQEVAEALHLLTDDRVEVTQEGLAIKIDGENTSGLVEDKEQISVLAELVMSAHRGGRVGGLTSISNWLERKAEKSDVPELIDRV